MMKRGSYRLSPEFVLLGLLSQSPSHGYELHQRLVNQFGMIWHTSQSQTYNILKRLESQGYVHATSIEQEKLPDRQQLELTAPGRQRFESWLAQPSKPSVHAIRVEFITRLYFVQLYHPEWVEGMIEAQASVVRAGLAELNNQLEKIPGGADINRLGIELRLELLGSVYHWLERCKQESIGGGSWSGG